MNAERSPRVAALEECFARDAGLLEVGARFAAVGARRATRRLQRDIVVALGVEPVTLLRRLNWAWHAGAISAGRAIVVVEAVALAIASKLLGVCLRPAT